MTEITTEATETTVDTVKAKAIEFVNSHSMADIIDALAESERRLQISRDATATIRTRLQETVDTVTEFIKENITSGASNADLVALAEELDIELTKNVSVSFTVEYTAELTVPLDFDIEDIDGSDFDVEISYTNHDNDIQFDNDNSDINDFSVEEN